MRHLIEIITIALLALALLCCLIEVVAHAWRGNWATVLLFGGIIAAVAPGVQSLIRELKEQWL